MSLAYYIKRYQNALCLNNYNFHTNHFGKPRPIQCIGANRAEKCALTLSWATAQYCIATAIMKPLLSNY